MAGPGRKLPPQVDPRAMYNNVVNPGAPEISGLFHRINGPPPGSGRMGNGGPPGGPLLGRQGESLRLQAGKGREINRDL